MSKTSSVYSHCRLCPKECLVDRHSGERGFCGQDDHIHIACAGLHTGEEPPVTGTGGSGTVFFSGCTLRCPFCQNCQISLEGIGKSVTESDLAEIFLRLQGLGAENINLVTGTPFVHGVLAALKLSGGLSVPVVWNTSGYEKLSTLEMLYNEIDIFLPDLKTLSPDLAGRLFGAPDYPQVAGEAVLRMVQMKEMVIRNDRLVRGVMVRHLVIPGETPSTREVLKWYSEHLAGRAMMSLLFQYLPPGPRMGTAENSSVPRRRVNREEYEQVISWLDEFEIEDGFCQDLPENSDWKPDFTQADPFPSEFWTPIWHYESGWILR